jgi:hypothetical protein
MKIKHSFLILTAIIVASSSTLLYAGQPHMENALGNLRAARHQLEVARHDKGGHRERAIQIIDNAISEVEAGMAAAD